MYCPGASLECERQLALIRTVSEKVGGGCRRLESMQPREKPLQLRAGKLLLAVYGDNWCA